MVKKKLETNFSSYLHWVVMILNFVNHFHINLEESDAI